MKREYLFESTVKVREFETDMQGVVNNAYYHNLLEQTRTEFFESVGIDVKDWSNNLGIDFVVYKTSIQYRSAIAGGETFRSCLNMRREGARYIFSQEFRREESGELCIKARVELVVGQNGKLTRGNYLADFLDGKINIPEKSRTYSSKEIEELDNVLFDYEMKVRDHECNKFGSATNAVVQSYLEVTRLEFMESVGESFRHLHQKGIDLMVARIDLKFMRPMRSSHKYHSMMDVRQEGPRAIFSQEIRSNVTNKVCVKAQCEIVVIVDGVLEMGSIIENFMQIQLPAWQEKYRKQIS